ncbi:MAG: zf-TFIIB domain-containing protein [Holophaga sp.]|nr:zf-TFIIB domain-containing protein [Holophaga sp.]
MKCPKCTITLLLAERQGVEIDYCPECRGVWLDRGELDKIIEKMSAQEQPAQGQHAVQVGQRQVNCASHIEQPMPSGFGHHPQQGHHGGHHGDKHGHKYGHEQHGYKHKRKSLLGELFDF